MTFLIRCFLPQMCFYGFTALAAAFLNARRRFAAAAYAPVLNNVVVVCMLLAFSRLAAGPQENWVDVSRIQGDEGLLLLLGLGTTAGIAAMALVLVPAVARAGAHLRFVFEWRNPAVKRVVRLSGWTVGYVVTNQIALLFVLVLAATGDAGNVSAYQYAFIFFQLPHGLFAVSIMTTMTPELARHYSAGNLPAMRDDFTLGLRYMLLVVVPSAVGLAVLAQPALSILVRGGFDASDATVTADTLQAFAIGLVPFSVYLYTLRGFYALPGHAHAVLRERVRERCQRAPRARAVPRARRAGARARLLGRLPACRRRRARPAHAPHRADPAAGSDRDGRAGADRRRRARCRGRTHRGRDRAGHARRAALAVAAGALTGSLAYIGILAALRADELRGLVRVVRRRRASDPDV